MLRTLEYTTDKPFLFECGGELDSVTMVYHTSDREYRPGVDKVIWICHALTGNSNPEDWWPQMVGPGKSIDTDRYFVVCASMLCSSYGKCSPATVNKATGRPYLLDFPKTTIRDMVSAAILVRKHLGIDHIDVLLGPSIGGFLAYEWSILEPDVIGKVAFVATDFRAAPFLTAFNESQRMAIRADGTFFSSESVEGGREGLKCARSIALISYRTLEGYNSTQYETDDDVLFADRAASYQRHQGEKLVARDFDAYSYWYLTYALDSQNIGRGRGGVEAAFGMIRAKVLVVAITSDMIFIPSRSRYAASMIEGAEYHEIPSVFGHDGFLIETDRLKEILVPFIEN